MHALRSLPLLWPFIRPHCSWWQHHHPFTQRVHECHQKWQPRKCQQMHELGHSSPFTVQSWLFPWWQRRWRFWSHGPLDEHVQLRHVHFVHQSWWLKWCNQCRFLQMWVEDRLFHRPSLDLQIPFLLRSAISLSSLQSLLSLVHLRLMTGDQRSALRPAIPSSHHVLAVSVGSVLMA